MLYAGGVCSGDYVQAFQISDLADLMMLGLVCLQTSLNAALHKSGLATEPERYIALVAVNLGKQIMQTMDKQYLA